MKNKKKRINGRHISAVILSVCVVALLFAQPVTGSASYVISYSTSINTFIIDGQTEPASTEPPSADVTEPTSTDVTEPSSTDVTAPIATSVTEASRAPTIIPPAESNPTSAVSGGVKESSASETNAQGTVEKDAPTTGENSHSLIYVVIMLVCAAGIIFIWSPRKKKASDSDSEDDSD